MMINKRLILICEESKKVYAIYFTMQLDRNHL